MSVRVIRSDGIVYETMTKAAKDIGCTSQDISHVVRGLQKTVRGFSFREYREGDELPICNLYGCPERCRISLDGKEIECVDLESPYRCALYRMWKREGFKIYQYDEYND